MHKRAGRPTKNTCRRGGGGKGRRRRSPAVGARRKTAVAGAIYSNSSKAPNYSKGLIRAKRREIEARIGTPMREKAGDAGRNGAASLRSAADAGANANRGRPDGGSFYRWEQMRGRYGQEQALAGADPTAARIDNGHADAGEGGMDMRTPIWTPGPAFYPHPRFPAKY